MVTASPDVTVSTNLGPWVNRRGLFAKQALADTFKSERIPSTYRWEFSPTGQHIELGIAEMNLFILLSALGLSHAIYGERLLPIGTLYDPFIARGLDALNYACYQDARFILVATPSGITLAPEGGAHQSIMHAADRYRAGRAGVVRAGVRRRTRRRARLGARLHPEGRRRRPVGAELAARGDRRVGLPAALDPADRAAETGAYARSAARDHRRRLLAAPARAELPGGGRLRGRGRAGGDRGGRPDGGGPPRRRAPGRDLRRPAQCRLDGGAARPRARARPCPLAISSDCSTTCRRTAGIVTVLDGHPATLAWLGAVAGHRVRSLGVEHFGQTGSIPELYRHYGIDANAIVAAAAGDRAGPADPASARPRLSAQPS